MKFVPQQAALAELAVKYETLLRLRVARDQTELSRPVSKETKATLQSLSQAFPGCLRELDRCTSDQLLQRLEDVKLAQGGVRVAVWIPWVWRFHQLLRAALHAKRLTPEAQSQPQKETELSDFLKDCVRPAHGKLVPVVLAQLAHETNTPAAELSETLFPKRR
jgi:hypothetical protein